MVIEFWDSTIKSKCYEVKKTDYFSQTNHSEFQFVRSHSWDDLHGETNL